MPSEPSEKLSMPYISPEDMAGMEERARKEGKPVEELVLRASDNPDAAPVTDEQDALGILKRVVEERKPVNELRLRRQDDCHAIFGKMRRLVVAAGFPVDGHDSRNGRIDTGRISAPELDALEDEESADGEDSPERTGE